MNYYVSKTGGGDEVAELVTKGSVTAASAYNVAAIFCLPVPFPAKIPLSREKTHRPFCENPTNWLFFRGKKGENKESSSRCSIQVIQIGKERGSGSWGGFIRPKPLKLVWTRSFIQIRSLELGNKECKLMDNQEKQSGSTALIMIGCVMDLLSQFRYFGYEYKCAAVHSFGFRSLPSSTEARGVFIRAACFQFLKEGM
ncbi:hypothetical protein RHSIM_Rhsim02G0125300 [Rhododendron simsii]|uniref:Uncharacterized protein n=1 Tax=Rhododendron simsii TaxID=118357 RepID=A0A834LXH9_RHOSS|nr:hypothetical protein RHSIM_Rhsim02G0125300 [Rhododendron simsii]